MKAHIPAQNKLTAKQKTAIHEAAENVLDEKQRQRIRRWFKLMCIALHRRYGFSHDRLMTLIKEINDLTVESKKDEVFWAHADKVITEELNLPFEKEK